MVAPQLRSQGHRAPAQPGRQANPYLDFGPNLEVAADALMVVAPEPGRRRASSRPPGPPATFELERVSGPLIDITADGRIRGRGPAHRRPGGRGPAGASSTHGPGRRAGRPAHHARRADRARAEGQARQPHPGPGGRRRARARRCTVAAGLTVDALRRQRREAGRRGPSGPSGTGTTPTPRGPSSRSSRWPRPVAAVSAGNGGGRQRPRPARRRPPEPAAADVRTAAATAAADRGPDERRRSRRASSSANGRPPVARPRPGARADRQRATRAAPGRTGRTDAPDRSGPAPPAGRRRAARR